MSNLLNTNDALFLERLSKCPELRNKFEEILNLSENSELLFDDIEANLTIILKATGSQLLHCWSESRATEFSVSPSCYKKDGKKNFCGIHVMDH